MPTGIKELMTPFLTITIESARRIHDRFKSEHGFRWFHQCETGETTWASEPVYGFQPWAKSMQMPILHSYEVPEHILNSSSPIPPSNPYPALPKATLDDLPRE